MEVQGLRYDDPVHPNPIINNRSCLAFIGYYFFGIIFIIDLEALILDESDILGSICLLKIPSSSCSTMMVGASSPTICVMEMWHDLFFDDNC